MKKLLIALVCLSAFLVLAGCGPQVPTPVPPTDVPPTEAPAATTVPPTATAEAQASTICAQGTTPSYLKEVVLAKDVKGDNFTPVDTTDSYDPTQGTFHAVVTLTDAPKGLKLRSSWYLVQATGYKPNSKIDEKELSVADGGSRNVDFTLKGTNPTWPSGAYCVEIYAEGNLALSKNFKVNGDTTPSNAGASVVKQVVLAEDTKPSTFEPINPTTIFRANAPFIHAVVQIENAPANTKYRARWYPPGQDPLDFDLQADGTRWLDFRLTPAPNGFPTGDYKVELYVNEQLVNTQTFTVQ